MGARCYLEIPGTQTHELPPLLLHSAGTRDEDLLNQAAGIVEEEDMVHDSNASLELFEQRKFDLAVNLAERYQALVAHWEWGDSIVDWIRQCEITFAQLDTLRPFLHPDVWPHAGRSSFITLLAEKRVTAPGVTLEQAVGLRLTFRQPPPIACCTDQFLFYLNSPVAGTAYRRWTHSMLHPPALLPPNRFHFQVLDVNSECLSPNDGALY